jgi:transposase
MRLLREIIRLGFDLNLSANEIHRTTGVSRGVVQRCIKTGKEKNITWAAVCDMDDTSLESLLFPMQQTKEQRLQEPDWDWIEKELPKRGVNRRLLWVEYIGKSRKGKYSYSQFNRLVKERMRSQDISMRQEHKAGDKLFVDYAGDTLAVIDQTTGEVKMAQIFVAVLGASNYTYAEAAWSQDLPSWIAAHIRALNFIQGVPACIVPDNLKSAVTRAAPFDPLVNRTYARFAQHYKCSIRPARKYHPKDKAKVEKGVQHAETWILARLRNTTFFSLQQLNDAIQLLLTELNDEPFQKMNGSRASVFREIENPALQPLPTTDFEIEDWLTGLKVPKDYHVTVEGHHYSVPYYLRSEFVDVRFTDTFVEIIHNNIRVASHVRNKIQQGKSTLDEHLAPQHAIYAGMTTHGFLKKAHEVGSFTTRAIKAIIAAHPYPQLAMDKCFGILYSLREKYGDKKLEAAAEFAIRSGYPTYRMIKLALTIEGELPKQLALPTIDSHPNIRGPKEYCKEATTS